MKKIEICGYDVTYHFKDEAGNPTEMTISESDINCIERKIDVLGESKGKLVINPSVTLFWTAHFD